MPPTRCHDSMPEQPTSPMSTQCRLPAQPPGCTTVRLTTRSQSIAPLLFLTPRRIQRLPELCTTYEPDIAYIGRVSRGPTVECIDWNIARTMHEQMSHNAPRHCSLSTYHCFDGYYCTLHGNTVCTSLGGLQLWYTGMAIIVPATA